MFHAYSHVMKKQQPRVAARRVVFESRRFRVIEKDMEFANGEKETWEVVEIKGNGAARAIALTDTHELIFVREYRGAAEKYVIRFPTGLIEENETPQEAASRELEEETGFLAHTLEPLGIFEFTGGYVKSVPFHIFFATDLWFTGTISREPGEQDMEVIRIPLEKAYQMAQALEFEDPETIYAILLLKKHLR